MGPTKLCSSSVFRSLNHKVVVCPDIVFVCMSILWKPGHGDNDLTELTEVH